MGQEFTVRMHTYFEVALDGAKRLYRASKYLPTRGQILEYCRERGLVLQCISQIVFFQITDQEYVFPAQEL